MANKNSQMTKQLRAAVKRRAKRPVAQFVPPSSLKAKGGVERRMIRDHQDLLQNIEFVLVRAARHSDKVDDCVVEQVLRAAIARREPSQPAAMRAKAELEAIRNFREDITDDVWINGLQTVYKSVRRHSDCRPGSTDYLDFIAQYIR